MKRNATKQRPPPLPGVDDSPAPSLAVSACVEWEGAPALLYTLDDARRLQRSFPRSIHLPRGRVCVATSTEPVAVSRGSTLRECFGELRRRAGATAAVRDVVDAHARLVASTDAWDNTAAVYGCHGGVFALTCRKKKGTVPLLMSDEAEVSISRLTI